MPLGITLMTLLGFMILVWNGSRSTTVGMLSKQVEIMREEINELQKRMDRLQKGEGERRPQNGSW